MTLASLGEAYVGQLARMTGVQWRRVRAALEGDGTEYSHALSLVALGMAEVVHVNGGRAFRITTRGKRKARSIAAHYARKNRGWSTRERVIAEGHLTGQVTPSTRPRDGSGDRTDAT